MSGDIEEVWRRAGCAVRLIEKHVDEPSVRSELDAFAVLAVDLADEVERLRAERDAIQATLTAVEHEVAQVYCHITGGAISKINTLAADVIAVADDVAVRVSRPLPAYAEITPEQAEAYLRKNGWMRISDTEDGRDVWNRKGIGGGEPYVYQPRNAGWGASFDDDMAEMCAALGKHEGRCGCDVARDMAAIEVQR